MSSRLLRVGIEGCSVLVQHSELGGAENAAARRGDDSLQLGHGGMGRYRPRGCRRPCYGRILRNLTAVEGGIKFHSAEAAGRVGFSGRRASMRALIVGAGSVGGYFGGRL